MKKIRAPGKLMLAGEYAVLHGGSSMVMAVDRYASATVVANEPSFTPPEAVEALRIAHESGWISNIPHVDVDTNSMRYQGSKLGIGSSAAACVAALGAALSEQGIDPQEHRERVGAIARVAHRRVQHGGSGVDVLASAWGGVLNVSFPSGLTQDAQVAPAKWPEEWPFAVLWSGTSASTRDLVAQVNAWKDGTPQSFDRIMNEVHSATECLQRACERGANGLADAMHAFKQHFSAMNQLGAASHAPVITESMEQLARAGEPLGVVVKPSGAGGGDVVIVLAENGAAMNAFVTHVPSFGWTHVSVKMSSHGVSCI